MRHDGDATNDQIIAAKSASLVLFREALRNHHEGTAQRGLKMANTQRTAIVTGGSQGIGGGLVKAFLDRGYNVVANSRNITTSGAFEASDNLALVDGSIANITLLRLGAIFEKKANWQPFAITDGRLVTGQNPASSTSAAQALLKLMTV